MQFSVSVTKWIVVSLSLCLTACAVHAPPPTTRICNANGCADQPRNYAGFDAAKATADDDQEGKIAALEALAKSDPRAAYDLALRFFRGDGLRQDSYRSLKWMRDAAERGDLNAQKALGRLYLTGMGEMGSDPGEAEKWLSITASRGDREAATLLKEATAARKNVQAEYRWHTRWQPVFYNAWYSSYRYYWSWGRGRWYLLY